ncbi:MAG TPA: hypothetical protein VHJ18_22405 [Streptosporangiaceae bacterium]|nr:hypothetical protein [Streptosporangiaceae bacterium]
MNKTTSWMFVDCEARGVSPVHGVLTEFGAVHYDTRDTFHGRLFDATPDPDNPAVSIVGDRIASDRKLPRASRPGCRITSVADGLFLSATTPLTTGNG